MRRPYDAVPLERRAAVGAMRIAIVTPAPAGSRLGNRVTAERWARLLRGLGHRVRVLERWDRGDEDLLVALHARKSAGSVRRWRRRRGAAPVMLALTGTDVYGDLARSKVARETVASADRLVVLQPLAVRALPRAARARTRVIHQSVPPPRAARRRAGGAFPVLVLGHLRAVKDPFVVARAVGRLPEGSRVEVVHAGAAHGRGIAARARRETRRDGAWRWVGDLPRSRALRLLAASRLLVVPSRAEGGANVVGEACVAGVPVLATRIPGNVGLLGPRYPGYFPVGGTAALARLLRRAEAQPAFLARLARAVRARAPLFDPRRERAAWRRLLAEVAP